MPVVEGGPEHGGHTGIALERRELGFVLGPDAVPGPGERLDGVLGHRRLAQRGQDGTDVAEVIEGDLGQLLLRADDRTLMDDDALEEALRRRTRQLVQDTLGRKPEVQVIISRLSPA